MNTKSSLVRELKDKEYRDSYVASQIRIGLPMQCRALRESREWTQPRLAQLSGMSQPRISEIERPGERRLNIETLLRLASAFDVALQVRFVPFSRLVDDDEDIDLNRFYVKPFDEDLASIERIEEQLKSVVVLGAASQAAAPGWSAQSSDKFTINTLEKSDKSQLQSNTNNFSAVRAAAESLETASHGTTGSIAS